MTMGERLLRVPEVARRLNMYGPDVYELIRTGELDAGKGRDGLVYVPEKALREYERRRLHGTTLREGSRSSPSGGRRAETREELLRVPEVARRLGMHGPDVYELIRTRELDAGKGRDGLVYVPEEALRDFQRRRSEASSSS